MWSCCRSLRAQVAGAAFFLLQLAIPAFSEHASVHPGGVDNVQTRPNDDPIFWDDFETGAVEQWSAAVGYLPPPSNGTCATATNLGAIWDNQAWGPIEVVLTSQSTQPGTSRWYHVSAADTFGEGWKLLAKAWNVTGGTDVDLYAYRRSAGNVCSSAPAVVPAEPQSCNVNISGCGGSQENSNRCSLQPAGEPECVSWFEACTGFLETDETEVWIEVRHTGGGVATFDLKLRNNGNNDNLTCSNY